MLSGNDAIMDWVCQKVCRLRIPILLPTIYVRIDNYPVTCSSLEKAGGRSSCSAIFNNYFRVLRQVMLLLVTLFASLVLVSSARQVCSFIEDDTWAQVDIELNIIIYFIILFIL